MTNYQHDEALQEMERERFSYCNRHGGIASIINCYECVAEFSEDEFDVIEPSEDDTWL
jgi:hypothetical protein